MPLCSSHLITHPIPTCINYLTTGTVTETDTNLYALLINQSTNRQYLIAATSDESGLVEIDLTDVRLALGAYTLSLSLSNEDVHNKLDITIEGETAKDIYISWQPVHATDDVAAVVSYALTLVTES